MPTLAAPPAAGMVVCGTERVVKATWFWWCDASFVAICPGWKLNLNPAVACFTAKRHWVLQI